jgi:chitinase
VRECFGCCCSDLLTLHLVAKGKFIHEKGLAGFAMWNVGSDASDNSLLEAITGSMTAES